MQGYMRVIGIMSGTSCDGVDVAVADISLTGDTIVLVPVGALSVPYEPALRDELSGALPPAVTTMETVCRLDTLLGQTFAAAARQATRRLALSSGAELVVSHGQTVYHWVSAGQARGTLQLGSPAWIAEHTGLPVVSDLRSADIAAGGQGAPLVSLFDALLLPPTDAPRAALNLGGIANMTVIQPDGDVFAYDLGPANALIDAGMHALFGEDSDINGAVAARGTSRADLLAALFDDPYFTRRPPKSTGKELFNWEYVRSRTATLPAASDADVMATVTEFTARVVATECFSLGVTEVIASGGGTRNPVLMNRLRELSAEAAVGPVSVRTIDELGVCGDAKEAYAFALLGYLTARGVAGSLPACTGARRAAVLGTITPGSGPLRLPEPAADEPVRLRIAT